MSPRTLLTSIRTGNGNPLKHSRGKALRRVVKLPLIRCACHAEKYRCGWPRLIVAVVISGLMVVKPS